MMPQFPLITRWLGEHGVSLVVSAPRDPEGLCSFSEEARLAEVMQVHRKSEFLTGRSAAREALAGCGGPVCAIPQGERGEPIWPAGYRGSITHTKGLVAAACMAQTHPVFVPAALNGTEVLHQKKILAVGIDLEGAGRKLSDAAWHHILSDDDAQHLAGVDDFRLKLVVFSAKESLYKALYPLCGEFFGFHDASLQFGSFWGIDSGRELAAGASSGMLSGEAVLRVDRSLGGGCCARGTMALCRWEVDGDWLLTAVLLPADGTRMKTLSD